MQRTVKRNVLAVLATAVLSMALLAGPAAAQPVVTGGLVNVTVADITVEELIEIGDVTVEDLIDVHDVGIIAQVQVPIGIAANVCPNVNAAVLAQDLVQTGEAGCIADADSAADSRAFQRFPR